MFKIVFTHLLVWILAYYGLLNVTNFHKIPKDVHVCQKYNLQSVYELVLDKRQQQYHEIRILFFALENFMFLSHGKKQSSKFSGCSMKIATFAMKSNNLDNYSQWHYF
jgi:F0F1-type ATP synthase membrane subunit a